MSSNDLQLNFHCKKRVQEIEPLKVEVGRELMKSEVKGCIKLEKKNVRRRRYNPVWEKKVGIKEWILRMPGDDTKAYCKFCRSEVRAHLADLKNHGKTQKHIRRSIENSCESSAKLRFNSINGGAFDCSKVLNFEMDSSNCSKLSVGFIGSGNMAKALLSGFIKSEIVLNRNVIVSAPSENNLKNLKEYGVVTTHNNDDVIRSSSIVFLCVKPHVLPTVAENLELNENTCKLFVSVAAGVPISKLEQMLSRNGVVPKVIRVMPNTPCMVSEGCCVYSAGSRVDSNDKFLVQKLLSSVGVCIEVPESQMDAACGVAGSGPAYIYSVIESMADGGVKMGLPRHVAQTLAAQTVKGAASMVLTQNKHPGLLKDEVCSPGGTTITAMHVLEKHALRNTLISAVEASATKSKELGQK